MYYICIYVVAAQRNLISTVSISTPNEASIEFSAVVADIAEELNSCVTTDINKIKAVCYNLTTSYDKALLSPSEKEKIKNCKCIYGIFEIVHPHWRWDSHRLLFTIIKRVKCPKALELLRKFEKKIDYQMKIKEIYAHIQCNRLPVPEGYAEVEAIIEKDYNDVTLKEFSVLEEFVHKYLDIIQCPFEVNPAQSIQVIWLVYIEAVDSLCARAFECKEAFLQNSFTSLKIGDIDILTSSQVSLISYFTDEHTYVHICKICLFNPLIATQQLCIISYKEVMMSYM